jgi:hypothetical protein
VWGGSIVVPSNLSLYAHFKVDANGKYKTVVCNGNYDDKSGSSISQYSGTLKNGTGRVRIRFADNYAGKNAYLTILHAEVCIEKAAVKTSSPTQPSTTPEFKCQSNQDFWTQKSSNPYYFNKGTGECIKCPFDIGFMLSLTPGFSLLIR